MFRESPTSWILGWVMRGRVRVRGGTGSLAGLLGLVVAAGTLTGVAEAVPPALPRNLPAAEGKPSAGEVSAVQALVVAERTGQPVEVLSQRGESRDVFATPD